VARRKDHTREGLRALIVDAASRHMADVGLSRFSSRQVAKDIGYSVGTIYNVFENLDRLLIAVNTRTFVTWADDVQTALAARDEDAIETLVMSYFAFARTNRNLWRAVYAHGIPEGMELDASDHETRGRLTSLIGERISMLLPGRDRDSLASLTRSMIAIVHGHCSMEDDGAYRLMGSEDAPRDALARIREVVAQNTNPNLPSENG
jgi:AcrR family transcriptional regulator